jgi:hypothetical protein
MTTKPRTAALLVAVVSLLGACASESVPTTTLDETPVTDPPGDPESDALATVDRYLAAFNSGDVGATLAFFVDEGGDFTVTTDPADTPFAQSGYDGTTRFIAYSTAAQTTLTNPECSAAEDQGAIVVDCSLTLVELLRSTMGLPALEASLTAVVADGRFIGFNETIVLAEGSASGEYLEWLEGTYPDEVEQAGDVEWTSVEEAVAAGEARVRHVDEWAASLEG